MVSENIFELNKLHIFLRFPLHSIPTKPSQEYFYRFHWKPVVVSVPNFPDLAVADQQLSGVESFFSITSASQNNHRALLLPDTIFLVLFEAKTVSPCCHLLLKFAFSWAEVLD